MMKSSTVTMGLDAANRGPTRLQCHEINRPVNLDKCLRVWRFATRGARSYGAGNFGRQGTSGAVDWDASRPVRQLRERRIWLPKASCRDERVLYLTGHQLKDPPTWRYHDDQDFHS